MSENPYSSDDYATYSDGPTKTSALAVCSLICSLICCIPGLGLLGVLLGIFAFIGIARSNGRVGGKALAIIGIILGSLVSFIWVGGGFAMSAMMGEMSKMHVFIEYAQDEDLAKANALVETAYTDEQIIAFGDAVEAACGDYISGPQGTMEFLRSMSEAMSDPASGPLMIPGSFPLMVEFDSGKAFVMLVPSQNGATTSKGLPAMGDVVVVTPSGSTISLSDFASDGTPRKGSGLELPAPDTDSAESPESQSETGTPTEGDTEGP